MKEITREIEERLARSLTWDSTEILPFLPYLLQDFWELGSNPDLMASLFSNYVEVSEETRVLDLACGKGAVSVKIAKERQVNVKGIDLIPEFVEYAKEKACEHQVENLCEFEIDDINEAVKTEVGFDCTVFGAVGPEVLGGPAETLAKLRATVKPGGYLLIEEAYLPAGGSREAVRYLRDVYLTEQEWLTLFKETDLELIETAFSGSSDTYDSESEMHALTTRANELIHKHPEKRELFEGYVQSQQNEYDDIVDSLVCVTWVLQRPKQAQ